MGKERAVAASGGNNPGNVFPSLFNLFKHVPERNAQKRLTIQIKLIKNPPEKILEMSVSS